MDASASAALGDAAGPRPSRRGGCLPVGDRPAAAPDRPRRRDAVAAAAAAAAALRPAMAGLFSPKAEAGSPAASPPGPGLTASLAWDGSSASASASSRSSPSRSRSLSLASSGPDADGPPDFADFSQFAHWAHDDSPPSSVSDATCRQPVREALGRCQGGESDAQGRRDVVDTAKAEDRAEDHGGGGGPGEPDRSGRTPRTTDPLCARPISASDHGDLRGRDDDLDLDLDLDLDVDRDHGEQVALARRDGEPAGFDADGSDAGRHGGRGGRELSLLRLILLTISLAGMQFTWTVELSYGTPYLLSLGLPAWGMALVWLAGPLSGLFIQPLVGVLSDHSTHWLGRRRPFMIGAGLLVVLSMVGIADSRGIAAMLTPLRGPPRGTDPSLGGMGVAGDLTHMADGADGADALLRRVTIAVAVLSFYCLDFSVNAVQASCRALIVDITPAHQQGLASAWAARMIGIGNVLGYAAGYVDLTQLWLAGAGVSQLKALCLIAILFFVATVALTCVTVTETPLRHSHAHANGDGDGDNDGDGDGEPRPRQTRRQAITAPFVRIWDAIGQLPQPIQCICNTQLWSWMAWFPFLFYATAWVGLQYDHDPRVQQVRAALAVATSATPTDGEPGVSVEGTRAGALAFLLYSLISLATGFALPMIAAMGRALMPASSLSSTMLAPAASPWGAPATEAPEPHAGRRAAAWRAWSAAQLTMPALWAHAHFLFAAMLLLTLLAENVLPFATAIVAVIGISWGTCQWVPFSLIGEYVSAQETALHASSSVSLSTPAASTAAVSASTSTAALGSARPSVSAAGPPSATSHASHHAALVAYTSLPSPHPDDVTSEGHVTLTLASPRERLMAARAPPRTPTLSAGMVLGIHNIYIVLPQFASTLLSTLVFALHARLADPSDPNRDPFGWVLRCAAIFAVMAALAAYHVPRMVT